MRARLDPESPIPLYWQVAEALRYQVATGELTPGQRLPSLRDAARAWGVNMHTVRRAYAKLAEGGIVQVRARSGTVVLKPPNGGDPTTLAPSGSGPGATDARSEEGRGRGDELEAWLREVARHGRVRWGLGPREIAATLADLPNPGHHDDPVFVVECSESQSEDLARQLTDRWKVMARPWSLEREGEPPDDAVLVGTYFHYNDFRVRWPRRFPRVRFVATRPDYAIRERLEAFRGDGDGPLTIALWERDEAMARNIAADLVRVLPEDEFVLRQQVGVPEGVDDLPLGPALFSPRTWARLPQSARRRRDFMEVRYVFDPSDLDRLARDLGWEER